MNCIQDASLPVLAQNLIRYVHRRCAPATIPTTNTCAIYGRKLPGKNAIVQRAQRIERRAGFKSLIKMNSDGTQPKKAESIPNPSPSASILLISSSNEILLLHRVKTATSFASAHVFPGGHLAFQDGELPPIADIRRHEDSRPYRMAAIRECFEESGILLANSREKPNELLILSDEDREQGRHAVHNNEIEFQAWINEKGGIPDVEHLIPFTRWLTPAHLPKRFTTQMYLYFLPLSPANPSVSSPFPQTSPYSNRIAKVQTPTPDGGLEHTAAAFHAPIEWLSLASKRDILLFLPQFFLLSLISPFLAPVSLEASGVSSISPITSLQYQREALVAFVESGDPPWGEKCISPSIISRDGKREILALDRPGPELQGTKRMGDLERIVIVNTKRANAQTPGLEVHLKEDFFQELEKEKL